MQLEGISPSSSSGRNVLSLGVAANPLSREELAFFCLLAETFCKTRLNCKDFFS